MGEMQSGYDKWTGLSDEDWVAMHVGRFCNGVRDCYEKYYEHFLREVLKTACSRVAPTAIVDARTKKISRFAEKILRKRKQYVDPKIPLPPDPLVRVTDLCGGRVITQTADQVHAVCMLIEQAFDIDWPNSEDVSQRLHPTEFGYRSVHYIVLANQEKLKNAGIAIKVPDEILGLKAEIQVRTLLEHAWADIGHDLTYKTELKLPSRITRQFAEVAAVLEGQDREFSRLVHALDEFKSNYGAYHKRQEVQDEITLLGIVLSRDKENVSLAVRIAQLAISIGDHEKAVEILNPYSQRSHQGVERVLGTALTEIHWGQPQSKDYLEGQKLLKNACEHSEKDAETLCALAESLLNQGEIGKARNTFGRAVSVDATEPLTLSRYLELEIANLKSDVMVPLVRPMIRNAVERGRKQIEARVNLPWAWASLATFHLFMDEPFKAAKALAKVIDLCEPSGSESTESARACGAPRRPCAAGRALLRAKDTFDRLAEVLDKLPALDWCERAVLLGLAVNKKDSAVLDALGKLASWRDEEPHLSRTDRIVILSGASAQNMQRAIDAFRSHLLHACDGLSFSLLSGGTTSGMSGLAGDIAEQSGGRIRSFGYLPRLRPNDVEVDRNPVRFVKCFSSPGSDFTPLDPQQGWIDLVASGVDPRCVKVISYAGGQISKTECILALALGARVGIIEDASLPQERQFNDPDWRDHPNLVRLPMDAMTLRAFILVDEFRCKRPEFEQAAMKAHEEYVKSATPREPSLLPWDQLAEDLQLDNYHQIAYAENILKTAGLGLRSISDPDRELFDMEGALGKEGIRRLAEMEHGRWNTERLLLGWRYGENKDVDRKLTPYLLPWKELSEDIQKLDIEGIRSLPKKLKAAGLEVFRLD